MSDQGKGPASELSLAAGFSPNFRALFEGTPTPLLVIAPPDWTIVAANNARLRATGTTHEDQIGRRLFDVFPDDPDDPAADGVRNLTASLARVLATRAADTMAVQRYAVRGPGGRFEERWWTPVNVPVLAENGQVALVIHRVEDVTEMIRLRGEAEARDQLAREQQAIIDRLRTTEAGLRASEEFNRRVLGASADCIKVLDLEARLEFMSEGGMRVMEVEDFGAVQGACWPDFWQGDEHPKALAAVEEAKRGGTGRFQGHANTMKGTPRWWDVIVTPINGPHGKPEKLLSISRDVTATREVEERLRESEAKFEAMANSIDQMIWSTRPDGYHDYYNDRWYEYTEVPHGSTDGEAWKEMFHPDDQERALSVWRHSLETGEPYHIEYRLRHRSGQYRWVIGRAQCVRDQAGRITRWYGTCTDVHDLKAAEGRLRELNDTLERRVADRTQELAESQRRFRGIFDSALQFMALLTPAGTVVEVNQTALDWSQITPADIVGQPFWLAAPMRGNPELQAAVKAGIQRAAAGETVRAEHEIRGAGEARAVVDFSLKPVLGERGEPIWLVAEGRDITELKRAQEALRQAQKLEAIGQLTGGVAHDFNNLLTVIKTSTDLLRKPGLAEERRRRYVDAIADTIDRASKLTGQLLAFARRQALKPEVFDPAQRVRSITEMLRTIVGARIHIAMEIGCEACHVEADASQFEIALVNMAVNARDAMNDEGRLTVRVDEVSAMPAIRGHSGGVGRFVAVSLTDTGCGIAPDKLDHIFEPFFTTKEVGKGTGLGLSQVFGFAKQSEGDVAVQSEIGRGTTFTLYLPRVEGDDARDRPSKEERAGGIEEHGDGRRVLVVEDNVEVGRFSTQILQDLGYETTWATNGTEALKVLSEANGFDAVFSDVVMPGMSGVDLGLEIRRRYPGLPVVLTSGYSHVLAEEGRHGFELIQKPYAAEELSRVLRRIIGARPAGRTSESST